MESLTRPVPIARIRAYLMVTKPGIIFGNVITAAGGFALASRGQFDFWLFLAMIEGLALIIAAGCTLNNTIDRVADKKMKRTRKRPTAKGLISHRAAIIFATCLTILGGSILILFTNLMTAMIALFGLFMYVVVYSFSKYLTHHGTLIGSIAGAVPPVAGYVAVTNQLDLGALILFVILAAWQMPHFFAIAIYRIKDYTAASIPVLPIKKGILATKIQMAVYVLVFMAACSLLAIFNYVGIGFLVVSALVGLIWLSVCLRGFKCKNDAKWARQVFIFSLLAVNAICMTIALTVSV